MPEPGNAFELLDLLKKKNGKQQQGFSEVTNYIGFKAREKGIPVSGQFELTPLCNFSCRMCYVHLNPEQLSQSVLPADTWKDLMHQAWEAGMLSATLTGGECLAYPRFEELFLYLHGLGCQVAVLTNGFLMDEHRIQFFEEHKPSKIQITLYGWNDDVYERVTGKRAFSTVAENIKRVVDAKLPLSVNITPSVFLGEDLFETIRMAKELCSNVTINSCLFDPREETGRSEQRDNPETEMYIRAYKYYDMLNGKEIKGIEPEKLPPCGGTNHETSQKGLRCGGGRSGFVINWKGILVPCNRMEIMHGDALQDGFAAAWAKVNQEANNWPRVPECEGCAYDGVCSNCAANMLRFADPGKMPTGLCEQTKEYVKHGVRHIRDCE